MRQEDLEIGAVYVMQRGPTRRALEVTLLDTTTPSGVRGRVLVRVESGVGIGREIETPTASLHPLYEAEPAAPDNEKPSKPAESKHEPAPDDWLPRCGDSVTWSQTGGVIFTVAQLTREGALITGELLGVKREFRAPFAELAPAVMPSLQIVPAPEEEEPIEPAPEEPPEEPLALGLIESDEDWVEEMIFSPKCVAFYRARFAKGKGLTAAEKKLRAELRTAKKVRPRRGGGYLHLRVHKRFDAVIRESPSRSAGDALYIDGLRPYVRRRAA